MTAPTAFVVGASSDIARAASARLAARGWSLILAGRATDELERTATDLEVRHGHRPTLVGMDLSDTAAIAEAANVAVRASGPLWILVFAGGDAEGDDLGDPAVARAILDANLGGVIQVIARLENRLRADGSGGVVLIGSVAGERGRMDKPVYAAAKAGLHAFAEGLSLRLAPFGVGVTLVKLGWVDTRGARGRMPPGLAVTPDRAAAAILKAMDNGRRTLYVPPWWGPVMALLRALPAGLYRRVLERREP